MNFTHDAFAERERSLENEFFYRVDQSLISEFRRKVEHTAGRERLAEATGIKDASLLDELMEQGIRAETLVALSLVPVIRVAFADRRMDDEEREAVLSAADSVGIQRDTASYQLLALWLERKPDERLFVAWKRYIHALSRTADTQTMEQLRTSITDRAREIARATGGFLRGPQWKLGYENRPLSGPAASSGDCIESDLRSSVRG